MKRIHLAGLIALGLLAVPWNGLAQAKKPGEAASLTGIELKGAVAPGSTVTALVKIKLEADYHVHSHQPSEPQFIATKTAVTAPAGVVAGTIVHPPGHSYAVKGLPKPLSVYEGEFTVEIPLKLGQDVKLPVEVPGTVSYQACQGAVCYPPRKLPFVIKLPAGK